MRLLSAFVFLLLCRICCAQGNPAETVFHWHNARDTVLQCADGVRLLVPSHAFAIQRTGESFFGSVTLVVREYTTAEQLFLHGITTNLGQRSFESHGMIFMEAYADTIPLELRSYIMVGFDDILNSNDALFYGGTDKIRPSWKATLPFAPAYHSCEFDGNCHCIEPSFEFPGGMKRLKEEVVRNFQYPQSAAQEYAEGKIYLEFTVSELGSIEDVRVRTGRHPDLDQAAVNAVSKLTYWHPRWKNGRYIPTKVRMTINIQLQQDTPVKQQSSLIVYPEDIDFPDVRSQRSFYDLQLGWIGAGSLPDDSVSCDVMVKMPDSRDSLALYLVLHEQRILAKAVFVADRYLFFNLPVNKEALLIAVHTGEEGEEIQFQKITTSDVLLEAASMKRADLPELYRRLHKTSW